MIGAFFYWWDVHHKFADCCYDIAKDVFDTGLDVIYAEIKVHLRKQKQRMETLEAQFKCNNCGDSCCHQYKTCLACHAQILLEEERVYQSLLEEE